MPDKVLIRFIAEGVLLKKLGPGVVQYSLKLLSNSFPGFFPTLTSFRSSKEKGRGCCPFCLNVKMVVSHFEEQSMSLSVFYSSH